MVARAVNGGEYRDRASRQISASGAPTPALSLRVRRGRYTTFRVHHVLAASLSRPKPKTPSATPRAPLSGSPAIHRGLATDGTLTPSASRSESAGSHAERRLPRSIHRIEAHAEPAFGPQLRVARGVSERAPSRAEDVPRGAPSPVRSAPCETAHLGGPARRSGERPGDCGRSHSAAAASQRPLSLPRRNGRLAYDI